MHGRTLMRASARVRVTTLAVCQRALSCISRNESPNRLRKGMITSETIICAKIWALRLPLIQMRSVLLLILIPAQTIIIPPLYEWTSWQNFKRSWRPEVLQIQERTKRESERQTQRQSYSSHFCVHEPIVNGSNGQKKYCWSVPIAVTVTKNPPTLRIKLDKFLAQFDTKSGAICPVQLIY